jgi:undecaprenyl diphosphate synthase
MDATACYDEGQLILALSYGGRAEIVDAARRIAGEVRAGRLAPEAIDDKLFAANLYAPDIPDPDLMIRTSGEMRISNFLLWELSYAEFYFTDVLWPDFREEHFREALAEYARRHRRFGRSE